MTDIENENDNVDDERDPRIDAVEYERLSPEVETGPDYRHWHYPDPKWHD